MAVSNGYLMTVFVAANADPAMNPDIPSSNDLFRPFFNCVFKLEVTAASAVRVFVVSVVMDAVVERNMDDKNCLREKSTFALIIGSIGFGSS